MIVINKAWAMPNSRTFNIPPIKQFVEKYIKNKSVIVDPFANACKYGTITNDLNPEYDTNYHMDALGFLKSLPTGSADVILYDPPYSTRQATECYKSYGKEKVEVSVTNMKYWSACKNEVARVVKHEGLVLCFGWNTNGCGKGRGFEMIEILIVSHGGSRNDTLCTVEKKNGG